MKNIFIRIVWFSLAVFLLVIVLRAAMKDDPLPKAFKEYPGIEYTDFPLPQDYTQKTEWTRARLKYTSFLDVHGPEIDDPSNVIRWTMDYSRSDRHFLAGIRRLTRIDTRSVEQVVELDGTNDIYNWPAMYSVEVGYWNITSDAQINQLREYLLRGGFLMVDDFHGTIEWNNFMTVIRKVFPDRPVTDIPNDDPIFHVIYDLDKRYQVPGAQFLFEPHSLYEYDGYEPKWRCIRNFDGKIMVAISFNSDLGDAWEWADDPRYNEKFSALAYQLGINYYMYDLSH